MSTEVRFVSVTKPGVVRDAQEQKRIREHVRKVVLKKNKHRNIQENFRFFEKSNCFKAAGLLPKLVRKRPSQHRDIKEQSEEYSCVEQKVATIFSKSADAKVVEGICDKVENTHQSVLRSRATGKWNTQSRESHLFQLLKSWHPFTVFMAEHVHLTPEKIDALLKNSAFRVSSEPLFDVRHVDSQLGMAAVFPQCLSDPGFVNALLYSVLQTLDNEAITEDGLRLQGKAVKYINKELESFGRVFHLPLIGTIMILKAVACRSNDTVAHHTHSLGFEHILNIWRCRGLQLPALIKRAAFWQDLLGAILVGSPRQMSHLMFPTLRWKRELLSSEAQSLPVGITAHKKLLIDDLLDCFADITELQAIVAQGEESHIQINSLQASIESRLVFQRRACQAFGVVAEGCRLAAFICCYNTCTEIWGNSLVPKKVSALLYVLLSGSLDHTAWTSCHDLQLWLLFVGACTALLDSFASEELVVQYQKLLEETYKRAMIWPNAKMLLHGAIENFLYCGDWRQRRCDIRHWVALEAAISSSPKNFKM